MVSFWYLLHHFYLANTHRRIPTKPSEAKLSDGELKDGGADDDEGEEPDEKAADQGGLGA